MEHFVKAPLYGEVVAADRRRIEFDSKNMVIVQKKFKPDFVFMGDSITQMWELNAYFYKSDKLIVNRGISGDITKYVLKRFEADVLQLNPKHCILQIGVNDAKDLAPNHLEFIPAKPLEEILFNSCNNVKNIVELCEKTDIKLIICSLLPTHMEWREEESKRVMYIEKFNEYLKELCKEKQLIYVDYYSEMIKDKINNKLEDFLPDGLHPNVFGYDKMFDILKETLGKYDINI